MHQKVMIVGDSLGLPRQNLAYEKTWPYKLSTSFPGQHFVVKVQRALTTAMLHEGVKEDWLEYYQPNVLILQIGIVDCAPRYVKRGSFLMKILNTLPGFIGTQGWKIVKRNGRKPDYADVSPSEFSVNLRKYLDRCQHMKVERVVLIGIARPGTPMVKNNPQVASQVVKYNQIINEVAHSYPNVTVISILENAHDGFFLDDGYHLNELGNQELFTALKNCIL